jgi:hypothetical protein
MAGIRRLHLPLIPVFLALAALRCLQDADAQISIVWRAALVSWDSPATQSQDGVATQVYDDTTRPLRDQAGAARRPSGRLTTPREHRRGDSPALTSRFTRSPPDA